MKAVKPTAAPKERVLLVLVDTGLDDAEAAISELAALAESAGGEVVAECVQKRDTLHRAVAVGTGKLDEIAALVEAHEVDTVIFDNALSGGQLRNLEERLHVKVLDRGSLILDIFASRAQSTEGKLQVELAQLKYTLPRLVGIGGKMSKMRSGIGMRGPGETKLETDRRIIRRKVYELEQRLSRLTDERALRRSKRSSGAVASVALVGYTNAGKSTLLNVLSKDNVLAEDKLFATLDPITRRVHAGEGRHYVLTDTVGFIDRLPHELVEAFSSTLEEARCADVLLHVVDLSNKELERHMAVVESVLTKLEVSLDNVVTVYNKADKAGDARVPLSDDAVVISALSGEGLEQLRAVIEQRLFGKDEQG